jgi:acyl carrier protein
MNATIDKSVVAARTRAIIVEKLGVEESTLMSNASFSDDLGLDSLDVLETFTALEKEFNIRIGDEDAEKLTTVGGVINYIMSQMR